MGKDGSSWGAFWGGVCRPRNALEALFTARGGLGGEGQIAMIARFVIPIYEDAYALADPRELIDNCTNIRYNGNNVSIILKHRFYIPQRRFSRQNRSLVISITSVQRALIILKQMSVSPNGVGVRAMARTLGYSPAVVQKSIQALVSQGFAQQDPETERYHLGPAALQVGLAGLARLEIRQVARPYLQVLAEASGETALLGVRLGDMATYIEKVRSLNELRSDAPVGARRPFNCTAVGKALLAYFPDEELERLHRDGAFVQSTPNSITDLTQLKLEMARVREQGLAIDREEFALGIMCLAAPVRNYNGAVVGAVALAGPVQRIQSAVEELSRHVISCAADISAALGYHSSALGSAMTAGRGVVLSRG